MRRFLIERKAWDMAAKIVKRTSTTMKLEDQGYTHTRINQAIEEMAEDVIYNLPIPLKTNPLYSPAPSLSHLF